MPTHQDYVRSCIVPAGYHHACIEKDTRRPRPAAGLNLAYLNDKYDVRDFMRCTELPDLPTVRSYLREARLNLEQF